MAKEELKLVANNKKAYHDYFILETFEAGIELKGTEIKSIRKGSANLKDCFVRIKDHEAFIENMYIETFRGLKKLKLEDLAQINILTGKNNSGKTSVLEMLKNFRNFMDWDHQNMLAGNKEILYTNAYLEEFQELFDIDFEEKIITYEVGLKCELLGH